MGVKWLLRWAPLPGTPVSPFDEQQLVQLLLRIGANPDGGPSKVAEPHVQCTMLHQAAGKEFGSNIARTSGPGGLKDIWSLTFTQAPSLCYFLIRSSSFVVEADIGMVAMMQRKMDYQTQSEITFESTLYPQGDFNIRLLITRHVLTGQVNLLGFGLEVEYKPLSDPEAAGPMLSAFVEVLQEHLQAMNESAEALQPKYSLELITSNFSKFTSLPRKYSTCHCAVAYIDLATSMATTQKSKPSSAVRSQPGVPGSAGTPNAATPPLM